MKQKEPSSPAQAPPLSETEELDEINAKTLAQKNVSEVIRRTLEAEIEAEAQRRRGQDVPASSGLKNKA